MKNLTTSWILFCFFGLLISPSFGGVQIISQSPSSERVVTSPTDSELTNRIKFLLSVTSESDGRDASVVVEELMVEEEGKETRMVKLGTPLVFTVNRSPTFAVYDLVNVNNVPYKPVEHFVHTRKCDPRAGKNVVGICKRLRDRNNNHIMEKTQPTCCPCGTGPDIRAPLSCGSSIDRLWKGKRNTAHCVRFGDDWFRVFSVGRASEYFSIRIEVKFGSIVSDMILSPENKTAISDDKFSKFQIIGDSEKLQTLPSFETMHLVIPYQKGGPGQPQDISRWMMIDKARFGPLCDQIGVSYEAFNRPNDFCSSRNWSCLHHQLWNYWEADQNRINNNMTTLYRLEGRFDRINQHPYAGNFSFSIGINEVSPITVLISLRADDLITSEIHEANQS